MRLRCYEVIALWRLDKFDEFVQEWYDWGGTKMLEEVNAWYDAHK